MSSLEKCLMKESRLKAFFQEQGEKRKFKERTFRTDDVDDLLSQGVTFQALCNLLGEKNRPVVWMGEDTFIRSPRLRERRAPETAPLGFGQLLDLHLEMSILSENDFFDIHVFGQRSSTPSYASLLSLLLHLIALDDNIRTVEMCRPSSVNPMYRPVLSVPPSALERFISNTHISREVRFVDFAISEEQGRALFFQCNPNVLLDRSTFDLLRDSGQFLMDALASNHQSPTSLLIVGMMMARLPDDLIQNFLLGLRSNRSLKNLKLDDLSFMSAHRLYLFLESLAGNQGLESLDWSNPPVYLYRKDEHWDALWDAVSLHPRMKSVHLRQERWMDDLTEEKKIHHTQSIVRALETNLHLSTIHVYAGFVDAELMETSVLPKVEINLFRTRIRVILQEPDQSLRYKIFGRALQHRRVQNNLTIRYRLLIENADLFQSHRAPPLLR